MNRFHNAGIGLVSVDVVLALLAAIVFVGIWIAIAFCVAERKELHYYESRQRLFSWQEATERLGKGKGVLILEANDLFWREIRPITRSDYSAKYDKDCMFLAAPSAYKKVAFLRDAFPSIDILVLEGSESLDNFMS